PTLREMNPVCVRGSKKAASRFSTLKGEIQPHAVGYARVSIRDQNLEMQLARVPGVGMLSPSDPILPRRLGRLTRNPTGNSVANYTRMRHRFSGLFGQ